MRPKNYLVTDEGKLNERTRNNELITAITVLGSALMSASSEFRRRSRKHAEAPLKRQSISTRLQGATSQNTWR
jgi:hypothetical protein